MQVFLTGATGFIGSRIVRQLVGAGHQVLGLARSDEGMKSLTAAGAKPHRGDLENLDSLRAGASASDAVIHTGFVHDFSRFKEVCDIDARAIEAMGAVLVGTQKPLIVSGGAALVSPGRMATERDSIPPGAPFPRVSEQATLALAAKGVNASVMRLPQVHDTVKQGLVSYLIATARQKGVSAYVGEGANRWSAAHVDDVALLYRLVLEKGVRGGTYHAVHEEGVPLKQIAEAIGRGLKIPVVSQTPEQAAAHFGFLAHFVTADIPASSKLTREGLGWNPTGVGMIEDLNNMDYTAVS